jgi:hypothetical protein
MGSCVKISLPFRGCHQLFPGRAPMPTHSRASDLATQVDRGHPRLVRSYSSRPSCVNLYLTIVSSGLNSSLFVNSLSIIPCGTMIVCRLFWNYIAISRCTSWLSSSSCSITYSVLRCTFMRPLVLLAYSHCSPGIRLISHSQPWSRTPATT